MNIDNLFTPELAERMRAEGFIRIQQHPSEDLFIANYTEKAQFQREWNPVTLNCRGLIFEPYGEIVARPFPKFFNYGEADRNMIPGGKIRVSEKMDGSLGILYQEPDSGLYSIATRGSFTSDQALHATRVLRTRYADFIPLAGFTYLFEIIYPENRIVVDYGDTDDLVLLDVINNATGFSAFEGISRDQSWPGPVAMQHAFHSLVDVVRAPDRENREGFVVYFERTGERIKVKHEEYVRLHRLLTNVSTKTVWELLMNGDNIDSMLADVPDEFYHWIQQQILNLKRDFDSRHNLAHNAYASISRALPDSLEHGTTEHRKAFAEQAKSSDLRGLLFALYDGKDITHAVWKLIKPAYSRPFVTGLEDAA